MGVVSRQDCAKGGMSSSSRTIRALIWLEVRDAGALARPRRLGARSAAEGRGVGRLDDAPALQVVAA